MNWKHNLENADGTRGPHFNMEQVMEAAKAVGIRFEDDDGPEPSEKLALYYYCIAEDE